MIRYLLIFPMSEIKFLLPALCSYNSYLRLIAGFRPNCELIL